MTGTNEPLRERLGREIRERRRQQGLRQDDLAFAAGLSRPAIVHVEQGRPGVRWETVERVVEALGLDLKLVNRGDEP